MRRTFVKKPITSSKIVSVRPYSDQLIDMYESGIVGSETLITLINYFSDQDIKEFMISEGLLDEEE